MDELLLSKIRLSVVTELLLVESMSFTELSRLVDTTAGNLASHIHKLVEAGYVGERKSFLGRRPLTTYRLAKRGKDALSAHAAWLQRIVAGAPSHLAKESA